MPRFYAAVCLVLSLALGACHNAPDPALEARPPSPASAATPAVPTPIVEEPPANRQGPPGEEAPDTTPGAAPDTPAPAPAATRALDLTLGPPSTRGVGETGTIQGTIFGSDGEPLVMANVVVSETTIGAATDFDGRYVLKDIPPGTHSLTASHPEFPKRSVSADVSAGETTTLDIHLE